MFTSVTCVRTCMRLELLRLMLGLLYQLSCYVDGMIPDLGWVRRWEI